MPGYRGQEDRTTSLVVRLTRSERELWTKYCAARRGYLSVLVRVAVTEYIARHPVSAHQGGLWEDR